jgi:hypothetical protein
LANFRKCHRTVFFVCPVNFTHSVTVIPDLNPPRIGSAELSFQHLVLQYFPFGFEFFTLNSDPHWRQFFTVDPPYQSQGHHYRNSAIDYDHLSQWARSRGGQIIFCENAPASYLPFEPFRQLRGVCEGGKRMTTEMMWHRP